jgi:carbonic anhydrase
MGHTQCGAVIATLKHIENPEKLSSENIQDIVSRIKPHVYPIAQMSGINHKEKVSRAIEANVLASVAQLSSSSRLIESLVFKKELKIMGAVLNLSSGCVEFLEV